MPKYRTGHTWWLGQTRTRGYYWNAIDKNYEEKYYQADIGTAWSYAAINFPNIPNPDVVQGIKKAENAVETVFQQLNRGDKEHEVRIRTHFNSICGSEA